jgi:uncharacterized protein YkwD
MKKLWIGLTLLTTATLLICASGILYASNLKPLEAPTIVRLNADVLFTKINDIRVQNGLKPLVRDTRLDTSAQTKADDMFTNKYFGHISPTGVRGYTLIPSGMCSYQSENLTNAIYSDNGDYTANAIRSWMASKPHREAILDPSYTLSGLAIHGSYAVQHFCKQ